ncbi:zinc finger protein 346-like isoform X2 [Uloborus diversus]|uniref:zinc finger protein 346-like isoform X2 n=1 Tax=Uloborus diversus TaxID=327109 RepID=UPI002409D9C4|nr:zinc finger protein 346-like isoform X2 [Uloborus diversus]
MWTCIACDKVLNSLQQYKEHLNSKKHKDKEEQNENSQAKSAQGSFSNTSSNLDESVIPFNLGFKCLACEIYLNSPQQAEQHKSGEKHQKIRSKTRGKGQNSANSCAQTTFSSHTTFNEIPPCRVNGILCSTLNELNDCLFPPSVGIKCIGCGTHLKSSQQAEHYKTYEKHIKMRSKTGERDHISSKTSIFNELQQFKDHPYTDTHGDADIVPVGSGFKCLACDIYLNSLQQAEQHKSGEKHQKMRSKTGDKGAQTTCSPAKFNNENILVNDDHFQNIKIEDVLKEIKTFKVDEAISFEKSVA